MGQKNSRGQNSCGLPQITLGLPNHRYQVIPGQKCQSSKRKVKTPKQKFKCPPPPPPCFYLPPPPPPPSSQFMYYMPQCQPPKPKQCCAVVQQCRTCCY